SPSFLTSGGFHISLESFHDAMKPRGEISNEVLACWIANNFVIFNDKCKEESKMQSIIKKYVFSHVITSQLIHEAENFKSQTCLRTVNLINKDQKLAKLDLIFFLIVQNSHRVLICINLLREQINYFDPLNKGHYSE
ncbi:hypothetical protein E2562_000975, partial [Oryza meyeriana var. granulata]